MTKWWIAFAIAVPLSYALGIHMAKADAGPQCTDSNTRATCILNIYRLQELKSFSCQLMYKVLYDDLSNKLKLHEANIYRMPASEKVRYEALVADFMKKCVSEDPEMDKIEGIKPIQIRGKP